MLDGAALTNLEVLLSSDGGEVGSLWRFLDKTSTPYGKRLLRDWTCAPLLNGAEIEQRLDAVEELIGPLSEVETVVRAKLKRVPDLEKLLVNVRSFGSKRRASSHPDSRARIFDADKLDKKKVAKLAELLDGMKALRAIVVSVAKNCDAPKSALLRALLTVEDSSSNNGGGGVGLFPDLSPALAFFDQHVDLAESKRTGSIEPKPGMDEDFDAAAEEEVQIRASLDELLVQEKQGFGGGQGALKGSGVKWWHHKTKMEDMYQLEVPQEWLKKHPLPSSGHYISKTQTSKVRRFHTPSIAKLLKDLEGALKKQDACKGDAMRKVFARFSEGGDVWSRAVRCLATLDALVSLAAVSSRPAFCRPQIVPETKSGEGEEGEEEAEVVFDAQQGRHPCLVLPPGQEAIPNDLKLGGRDSSGGGDDAKPRLLLLTGPSEW